MNTLINPELVYMPEASPEHKELFLFFCTAVAGKTAAVQAKKIDQFFHGFSKPFGMVRSLNDNGLLRGRMELVKLGQYTRLTKVWSNITNVFVNGMELNKADVSTLEKIVGLKTARFFILNTRKNADNIAVLDVHLLRHLRDLGYDAPVQTPSSPKTYAKWEKVLLDIVKNSGKTMAEYDIEVWKSHRKGEKIENS